MKQSNTTRDYIAFKTKGGLLPALCSPDLKQYNELKHELPIYIQNYIYNTKLVWVIPVETNSVPLGYVLKGYNIKSYRTINNTENQLIFGLFNFNGFKKDDSIIITEGIRDCLYIQQFYPYVISLLGSTMNELTFEMLSGITRNFVLAFDNDRSGQQASEYMKTKIKANRGSYKVLRPVCKDFGEYFYKNFNNGFRKEIERLSLMR